MLVTSEMSPEKTAAEVQRIIEERLIALGTVIEWSATMERTLRDAFCSLVSSKFAAIVAGGQSAVWLIEQCRALADAHAEFSDADKQAIKDALQRCKEANERRNELVHAIKTASSAPDGSLQTIRSRLRSHSPVITTWTPAEIRNAGAALLRADLGLFGTVQQVVSPEMMVIGDRLGWGGPLEEAAGRAVGGRGEG